MEGGEARENIINYFPVMTKGGKIAFHTKAIV
jgi:hypothetical protein